MPRRPVLLAFTAAVVLAAAGTAAANPPLPGLRSPSGNIRCLLLSVPTGSLLCSLDRAGYAAKLQNRCLNPGGRKGAGVDWHGFLLPTTREGEINCSGGALYDPARARYVTLAYGTTWRRGVFTCTSRRAGVTCRTAKGHGIFVSRGSWLTW